MEQMQGLSALSSYLTSTATHFTELKGFGPGEEDPFAFEPRAGRLSRVRRPAPVSRPTHPQPHTKPTKPGEHPHVIWPPIGKISIGRTLHQVSVGSSAMGLDQADAVTHSWGNLPGFEIPGHQGFKIRSSNYLRTKQKEKSGQSLMDVVAIDVFATESKLDNIGQYFAFPQNLEDSEMPDPDLAPYFLLNIQFPDYAPSLLASGGEDGAGWSMIYFCKLTAATIEAMKHPNPEPSVKLLKRFLTSHDGDAIRERVKIICDNTNKEKAAFNPVTRKLVISYNCTPFLAHPSQRFYRSRKYFELDLDVHKFSYFALTAFNSFKASIPTVDIDFGFLLEGRTETELPEQIAFSCMLLKLEPSKVLLLKPSERPKEVPNAPAPPLAGAVAGAASSSSASASSSSSSPSSSSSSPSSPSAPAAAGAATVSPPGAPVLPVVSEDEDNDVNWSDEEEEEGVLTILTEEERAAPVDFILA